TGYSNATTSNALTTSGTTLAQTVNGTGSGIQITVPANTYAVAFILTTVSGFGSPLIELGDRIVANANYQMSIPGGSALFFGILSDTPLTSLFVGNNSNLDGKVQINSFELGQGGGAQTPELSSLALIGTGLVSLGLLRRKRRLH